MLVLVGLTSVGLRNSMIAARNRCQQAWGDVEAQLKRRHDLVPNLVESAKGYAAHERGAIEAVTEARAAATRAAGVEEAGAAERRLSGALVDLRAVAENYPQLRATENFQQLSAELAQIEDQIQQARSFYNSHTQAYNTKIEVFPNSLIANSSNFQPGRYFELEDQSDRAPTAVSFDD
ncbi:MAG: LemA family protein [Solirubrobacterales bacterium]